MLCLPEEVTVFPSLAAAASRAGERHLFATWSILRLACAGNAASVSDVVDAIMRARHVTRSWAYRTLKRGEGRYWSRETSRRGTKTERIRPVSSGELALGLGATLMGRARKVRLGRLQSRADVTATIYAVALHPVAERDGRTSRTPLTRSQKSAQVRLGARHQRRLDDAGATAFVEATFARVVSLPTTDGGVFRSSTGDLLKRLGDRRVDSTSRLGAAYASKNARRDLARKSQADTATDQRLEVRRLRRTFRAKTKRAAWEKFIRSRDRRGIIEYREGARRQTFIVDRDLDDRDLERFFDLPSP